VRTWPAATARMAALAGLCLGPILSFAQTTNLSVNLEADAFIREAAPASNYGRAGALNVGGTSATNGFGVPGGRFDSLVRFRLNDTLGSLEKSFGDQDWFIAGAALRLYEMGAPNNPLFNRGVGVFEIRWLASGDDWPEGTGSPSAPTMDGVAFQDLASLMDPARDLSLGLFTNNGADGSLMVNLPLLPPFLEDPRSGNPTTLHFLPASDSIGFTFLSRSDPRTTLRITLELVVVAGPPPRIGSIDRVGENELAIRFLARSNWSHIVQYQDNLSTGPSFAWANLFSYPAQSQDSQLEARYTLTNVSRIYRLFLLPP
jgi:hypothetical protein